MEPPVTTSLVLGPHGHELNICGLGSWPYRRLPPTTTTGYAIGI